MANARESELVYPLGEQVPAPGEVLDLRPGVRWLRMGLPFALDHINLWLLRDEIDGVAGWTIVDCGIDSAPTREAWERVFQEQLQGLPVLRVIVTHFHPDHFGLAHWLTGKWNCRLWMSATDYHLGKMASTSTIGMGGATAADFFGSHGLTDPDSLEKIRARASYFPSMVPAVPPAFRRLMDGDVIRIGGQDWRCIAGHGHSPEHISLFCAAAKVLISGDMVLPRISTNVSVVDVEPEADPLRLYLDSLGRFDDLPADTLVLPAHGKPFTGLHQRISQLRDHHDERLAEVMEACATAPQTAAELLPVLFKRKLDLHQTTFAMGESVAHLNLLWMAGKLVRSRDAEGVWRYAPAG
jgi:glyoxylase-like metal-dependent hydrolase (beta-lactamase superfamily II)